MHYFQNSIEKSGERYAEDPRIEVSCKGKLLAYVDNIVILGYSQNEVEESTKKL